MTKYSKLKKAYDRMVEASKSPTANLKKRHDAREAFRAEAYKLFPRAGARAEAAARDLIDYYGELFSTRHKRNN